MRPPPKVCDNCDTPGVVLITNDKIYGELKGDWPYCYYCHRCDALAACHRNTYNPMGLMATSATRRRRTKLHDLFDVIWQNKYIERDEAYKWLANELQVGNNCHISELPTEKLKLSIEIMRTHRDNGYVFFKRRMQKNENRRTAAATRQHTKVKLRRYGKSR